MAKKKGSPAQLAARAKFKKAREYALASGAAPFSKAFGAKMKEYYRTH